MMGKGLLWKGLGGYKKTKGKEEEVDPPGPSTSWNQKNRANKKATGDGGGLNIDRRRKTNGKLKKQRGEKRGGGGAGGGGES